MSQQIKMKRANGGIEKMSRFSKEKTPFTPEI
jgi:hypothetical protein